MSVIIDGDAGGTAVTSTIYEQGSAFSATLSASQSITNATFTKCEFDSVTFDAEGDYDGTTNYRFQPTIDGYYQINFSTRIANVSTASTVVITALYKNGSEYQRVQGYSSSVNDDPAPCLSVVVHLNGSTDYVEGFVYHNALATESLTTNGSSISGHLVRKA